MSRYKLTAADRGVTRVRVDKEKVLHLDGESVELTKKELERVKALPGVKVEAEKSDQGS